MKYSLFYMNVFFGGWGSGIIGREQKANFLKCMDEKKSWGLDKTILM